MNWRWVSRILFLLMIVLVVVFFHEKWDQVRALKIVSPFGFFISCLGHVLTFLTSSGINFLFFKKFSSPVSFIACFHLVIVSTLSNLVLPLRGGFAVRAVYLKKIYEFSYKNFAVSLVGYYFLVLLVSSLLAILSLGVLWLKNPQNSFEFFSVLTFSILCFFGISSLAFLRKLPFERFHVIQKVNSLLLGFQDIARDRSLMKKLLGCALIEVLNGALVLGGGYHLLGIQVGVPELIAITVLGNISFFLSITPSGFGFYEATVAYVAQLASIPIVDSVAVSLLTRFLLIIVLVLIWPATYMFLSKVASQETLSKTKVDS